MATPATSPTRRSCGSGCSGSGSISTSTRRTCSGSGSTRSRRCGPTSTASRTPTPRTPRRSRRSATATASSAALHARGGPLGHGLVALPDPRPGRGRLPPLRRHALRGRLRRRALGRARGPGLGRHAGEDRGRARIAHRNLRPLVVACDARQVLEVRDLVKEYPGVKALQGVDFDVARGRGPLPAGPERRRQVDADQVRLRRRRADQRRDPLRRRAAAVRRSGGLAGARRGDDLPGARPRRGPDGRREHLPRPRAAPRPAARPGADAPRLGGAARAARPRGHPAARRRSARCAPPRSRSSRSRARSPATSAC